jgi:hypothetical protein
MNDITPTIGGKANGKIARDENILLPMNLYLVKIKAIGTPINAENRTLPTDIRTLFNSASRFALLSRLKNSR